MKIMEIIYNYEMGGSEVLGSQIAIGMKGRGYDVSVCATYSHHGPISKHLKMNGITCYAINSSNQNIFFTLFKLFLTFMKERPDVIHIHHAPMFKLCYYPAKFSGIKSMVLTEHTHYETATLKDYWSTMKWCVDRASRITVVHSQLKNYFVKEFSIQENKINVIVNGVDTNKYHPKMIDGKTKNINGKTKVGWVGRIHPQKDLSTLLKAVNCLIQDKYNIELNIVGYEDEPGELERLKNLATDLCITDYIRFLGMQENIHELMRDFDIFVLSSETEGLPLVLLEAMSSGLPIVATDVGGNAELLSGGAGVIVQKKDYKNLCAEVENIISNAHHASELAINARKKIIDLYSIDKMLDSYVNVLTMK